MLFTVVTIVFVSRHTVFSTRGSTLTRRHFHLAATIFLHELLRHEYRRIQQRTLVSLPRAYLHVYVSHPLVSTRKDCPINMLFTSK